MAFIFLVKMKKMATAIPTCALYCEESDWGDADATTLWLGGVNIHDFDNDPIKTAHYAEVNLPYHLNPNHIETTDRKPKSGMDAAY